jgi:predicted DNA-binding transcriptional regulator YafY
MAGNRLVSILLLLQARGQASAAQLAREFEVSVRTIHRDIDQMSAAGIPVYADRGRAGGFRLMDGYRTRFTGLTQSEAQSLFLAALPGPAADLGLTELLAAARTKLLAALPSGVKPNAERIVARFHLDPTAWFHATEPAALLPEIARAVWEERYLKVRYRRSSGPRLRKLAPLGLVLKGGTWYLVAQSGDAVLTYKVANVLDAQVTDETFARPRKFDLAAHWMTASRAYEEGLFREHAEVRLSPRGRELLSLLGPHVVRKATASMQIVDNSGADGTGWVRCNIPIESTAYGLRELMRLGREVEVIGPPDFRAAYIDELQALTHLHTRT